MKDILYILRKLSFQLVFTEEIRSTTRKSSSSKDEESDDNTGDDEFDKELKDLIKNANPVNISIIQIIISIYTSAYIISITERNM